MDIKLYGLGPTRSARVVWMLRELDLEFELIENRSLIGSEQLREFHPLAKLPAIVIDGKALFESVAICTYLADAHPQANLIAKTGTWERALHEQWSAFILSELEAWLWVNARHSFVYPEEHRIPEIIPLNEGEAKAALGVLEDALTESDYLVDDRFTVTDIVAAYAVNWARRTGLLADFPRLIAYLDRLAERPAYSLAQD